MFALVLPDLGDAAVDHPYTYRIPLELSVAVGTRVTVPLGARQVGGYVLEVTDRTELSPGRIKSISSVHAAPPAFTKGQAALARWIAETYLCPLSEALRPCLVDPGTLAPGQRWTATHEAGVTVLLPDPTMSAVLDFICAHPGTSSAQISGRFGMAGEGTLNVLRRDGLIRATGGARVKEREIAVVGTAHAPAVLREIADGLTARAAKQIELLRWAADHWTAHPDHRFTVADLAAQAEVGEAVVRACIAHGWLALESITKRRDPWATINGRKAEAPELTFAQREAVGAIVASVQSEEARSFLLFGVTGSGKTEVFLHAIAATLARGRQAIVLVPEISLTAQAMALYHGRFPGQVAILHSNLSAGERFDEWGRIARGEAQVVLGARSAIFAPCPNIGLIVVDEEHESSYKQETSPRYHARAVALERGRREGAPVVLASATPSLETMRAAELREHVLLRLPERIEARPLPPVKIVDLRRMTKNARVLSAPLRQAIDERLAAREQIILFLNRRGFAHMLLCPQCGEQEMCPHCAVPLTYHQAARLVRCHHCDYLAPATLCCSHCPSTQIAFKGAGTEQLEAEVQALWPDARLARLDRDTTTRKGSHHAILDAFARGETDILVGTQMVAKGLDFPRVTLVGVIAADISLGVPDFRAPERTFQLLTQVAGRAGRAEWPGEVIVQTFQPEHYAVQAAALHDYTSFYTAELPRRGDSAACWPPLTALINLVVSGMNEAEVRATAAALARRAREEGAERTALPAIPKEAMLPGLFDFLTEGEPEAPEVVEDDPFGAVALLERDLPAGITVNDAAPCPLPRLRGRYRYHLVLRGQDRAALRTLARRLLEIIPPRGVQVSVDVDPLSLA